MKLSYSAPTNSVIWTDLTPEDNAKALTVPGALQLAPAAVAAPCEIVSQVMAAKQGLPAYSPILASYDWPRSIKIKAPFAHQLEMAAFLTLFHRAHNLAEIGTGKTLGCLWAADFLMRHKFIRRVLIIGPLSTVESVWRDHIGEHFAGLRTCAVVAHDRARRLKALAQDVDFYIMNNEALTLPYVAEQLAKKGDIDLVIVDESDRYRNSSTDRYKALKAYIGAKALWLNTGTPMPQFPTDVWAQQALIKKPDISFRFFKMDTMIQVSTHVWAPKKEAKEKAARLLTPAIRFLRDECIDLPPTQVINRQVDKTPAQIVAIRELKRELKLNMPDGGQVTAVNEAVLRSKVLQVLAGAVYDTQHETHQIDASPRIAMLKDVIRASERKTLVFTHLSSIVRIVHAELKGEFAVEEVKGDTSLTNRTKIFKGFQGAGGPQVIVADPRTMSHGLTLTEADKIIWYTPCDSAGTYVQANGRITRPGQNSHTLIYQFWVDALEKEIFRRLETKEALQGLLMRWLDS
jgi:SNF2 family DNA or RNA helicase